MIPRAAQFARDEFGDAYWREFASDTTLTRSHEHVAVALVPTRQDAEALVDRIATNGVTAVISDYLGAAHLAWQVTISALLTPAPQAIDSFQRRLRDLVELRGGLMLDDVRAPPIQDAGPLI